MPIVLMTKPAGVQTPRAEVSGIQPSAMDARKTGSAAIQLPPTERTQTKPRTRPQRRDALPHYPAMRTSTTRTLMSCPATQTQTTERLTRCPAMQTRTGKTLTRCPAVQMRARKTLTRRLAMQTQTTALLIPTQVIRKSTIESRMRRARMRT
jgi:hypothetical protein